MSGAFGSSQWMYASGAAGFYSYSIDQSLRLDKASSANLSFTPSSAGSTNTGTISVWLKRTQVGTYQIVYQANGGTYDTVWINTSDNLQVILGSTSTAIVGWNRKFRDTGSWGHLVIKLDVSNGTANQRIIAYWNGEDMGAADLSGATTYPASSAVFGGWFKNAVTQRINFEGGSTYGDGYIAEMHVIDGTALDASSFGETSNGIWVPKAYSGSYGTNGFYLSFADSSAIGDDLSGNTNDWTANNLAASDVVPDSPTNNFATLNPLFNSVSQAVLSEGNLKAETAGFTSSAYGYGAASTFAIPKDKKIYIEVECTDVAGDSWFAGFATKTSIETGVAGNTGSDGAINVYNRSVKLNGTEIDYGASAGLGGLGVAKLAAGDILGCMCDGTTGKVWFSRNGTYFKTPTTDDSGTTGDPDNDNHEIGTLTGGTTDDIFLVLGGGTNANNIFVNFGQDSINVASAETDANGLGTFEYAPPTNYVCLCASSLSEPAIGPNSITQADDHFNTVLYTGDGTSSNAITGVGFQSDFLWIKQRSAIRGHQLMDSVRGASVRLRSEVTDAESTSGLVSFDSDGFTVDGSTLNGTNISGGTFVGWCWKAGGTAVSNTDGSITSSVSANQDAGFSIVSYEATGSNATVGHGLSSAAPEMIIIKERDNANGWAVSIKGDPTDFLRLDTTAAQSDDAAVFNDTAPTSTVFSIGTAAIVNRDSMIAYCFHSVDGFSKVGSYVGNGSADGTFVYTGFRPAFLIQRRTDTGNNWHTLDNKRDTFNVADAIVYPNLNNAEATGTAVDFLSNGFKIRSSAAAFNASGGSYIYLAFAEAPFKYANAR